MKFNEENKEEIYKRLNALEKQVENINQSLRSETSIKIDDQKKYEMNLTSGNRNFLKVLSISIVTFFIIYWVFRIINN
ncbi:MAG: hypothetical protein H2015_02800 [Chloroflexi bacterium]|nr:hypothetical protein [Chloroflexota bacterium]|tara:strand:- start:418 stop:651 length:234 start_codon:yes stop_codon:yes gene_type:complete